MAVYKKAVKFSLTRTDWYFNARFLPPSFPAPALTQSQHGCLLLLLPMLACYLFTLDSVHWGLSRPLFSPNQRSKAAFVKQIVGELQRVWWKPTPGLLGDITFLIIPLIGLISSKDYCTFSWRLMSSFMNIQNNPAALGQHWLLLWNSKELLQMSCWRLWNSSSPFSIWFLPQGSLLGYFSRVCKRSTKREREIASS